MIATRWVDATEEISTHLSVPVGEQVLFVRRLRLADHEVIGLSVPTLSRLPQAASWTP